MHGSPFQFWAMAQRKTFLLAQSSLSLWKDARSLCIIIMSFSLAEKVVWVQRSIVDVRQGGVLDTLYRL